MREKRFAFIELAPGINRRHIAAFFAVVILINVFAAFINISQPWLLSNLLGIPRGDQGRATSALMLAAELAMIVFVPLFGVLSDRVGRRVIVCSGFAITAVSVVLFPHATSLTMMVAARALTAVGVAALMATAIAVMVDYAADESRGKASGWMGFLGGFGGILAFVVLMRIPKWLTGEGPGTSVDMATVAHIWFCIVAGLAALACVVGLGLKGSAPHHTGARQRPPLLQMTREALLAARESPGIALSYGAAFVARGDMAVAGVFVVLWLNQAGERAGLPAEQVAARSGSIAVLAPLFAVLSAPLAGLLCDRVHRVVAVAVTVGLAGVAFNAMHFISDPLGLAMPAALAVIGVSEMGVFVSSQALMAQQAPEHLRGSVSGFFGMCGALGILCASLLGGYLFDVWRPSGPFVLFGLVNVVLLVAALVVRRRMLSTPAAKSGHGERAVASARA
jgi:MFS family permease